MTDSRFDFEQRLQQLERQNKWLKRAGLVLGLVVCSGTLMSMTFPNLCKTVWAERFVLKDGHGRERMVLDAYSNANPMLWVKDRNGKKVAKLECSGDEGACITVWGQDGSKPTKLSLGESPVTPAKGEKQRGSVN